MTPDIKNKVYLRTPNWDRGLPALSSVSWNISVPSNQVACLTFFKERSGVVCQSGRAFMIIQEQQSRAEEIFSLEEEVLPKPSFHRRNFWVNISNCSPVNGKQLDLLFWVTLTPRTTGKDSQSLRGWRRKKIGTWEAGNKLRRKSGNRWCPSDSCISELLYSNYCCSHIDWVSL